MKPKSFFYDYNYFNQLCVSFVYQGKHAAMFLCWFLGTGSLLPWNSMLTIEDYYSKIFPVKCKYTI